MTLEDAYRRWSHDLVAFATTMTGPEAAVDAVADVFQRLLADPDRWDAVDEPRAYLFRSVHNQVRHHGRSGTRRLAREHAGWGARPSVGTDPTADAAVATVVDRDLDVALGALSPQQRAVIDLVYWHDLTADQAAEILGVRPGTVRRQLDRARRRVRGALA
ncbi:MAG: RNA polymerase sigma factor [Actinomycetota bacterium]